MGIDIQLEDERGNRIDGTGDPNILSRFLSLAQDSSFICLRFVDPYGDTTFNGLQMEPLLQELQKIRSAAVTTQERELLNKIQELAERCQSSVHLYLKFYGD